MNVNTPWILARLREPSTWKGISVLAGAAGFAAAPELITQIGVVVASVIGLIDIFRREGV